MIYYLPRDYKNKNINDAGAKARFDIEKTLNKQGILPTSKGNHITKNRLLHFIRTICIVIKAGLLIKRNDKIILQYPVKYYSTICRIVHFKGGHVITTIHDLECFRKKHNTTNKEIKLMNMSDAIIAHNPIMCKWLIDNGYVGFNKKNIIESLGIFDFLSESENPNRIENWPLNQIVYAGQLTRKKNDFLYKLGSYMHNYNLNVYGKGFDKTSASNPEKFNIKGFMLPEKLISSSIGDFGLVWDGDSIDCCQGDWGEYLTINTPHKISLYIRCGLPVIIWSKAAMAAFIKENGIGLCIDSLHEINDIYNKLSKEEYTHMCDNVNRISNLMSKGDFIKQALNKTISNIK